jgi:hypothetical protein
MLSYEIGLLNMIKSFFDCGSILQNKDNSVDFSVCDINFLNNIILPHFLKYPLRGTKYLDFLSFERAINIIKSGNHLRMEGLNELIKLSNEMNSFRKHSIDYSPLHTLKISPTYIPLSGH